MKLEFVSAPLGERWVFFKAGADLSEYDETKLVTWMAEAKECTTETMIKVAETITVEPDSRSYNLEYNLAFCGVHISKIDGPKASDAPDRAFFLSLPSPFVSAMVNRLDSSRGFTKDDMDSLKKPKPSAGKSGDSALS